MQEACLKAIGYVSDDFISAIQDSKVNFDLTGLFEHVVFNYVTAVGKHDMKYNLSNSDYHFQLIALLLFFSSFFEDIPFLQGRAIVFASQFATFLSGELAARYVAATVDVIQRIESIPAKVSSLKALQKYVHFNQYCYL